MNKTEFRKSEYLMKLGCDPDAESLTATSKEFIAFVDKKSGKASVAIAAKYDELQDVSRTCVSLCSKEPDLQKHLYIDNVLMRTLIDTGIVSRPFATALLPYGYFDDYYHYCQLLWLKGKVTRNRTAKWLEAQIIKYRGTKNQLSPTRLSGLMSVIRSGGYQQQFIPNYLADPKITEDEAAKRLTDHFAMTYHNSVMEDEDD